MIATQRWRHSQMTKRTTRRRMRIRVAWRRTRASSSQAQQRKGGTRRALRKDHHDAHVKLTSWSNPLLIFAPYTRLLGVLREPRRHRCTGGYMAKQLGPKNQRREGRSRRSVSFLGGALSSVEESLFELSFREAARARRESSAFGTVRGIAEHRAFTGAINRVGNGATYWISASW